MGAALVIQIFVYSFKELSNIHFLSFKRKRDKQIGLGGPSDTRPKSYPHTLMTYSKHLLVWNVNTPKKYLHKRYIHFFKTGESWWKEYASKGKWIIATWQAVEQLVIVQNFMSCWIISCLAPGWGVGPYQTQKYKEQFTNFCVYVTRAAKCFLYSDKIFKIGLDPKNGHHCDNLMDKTHHMWDIFWTVQLQNVHQRCATLHLPKTAKMLTEMLHSISKSHSIFKIYSMFTIYF